MIAAIFEDNDWPADAHLAILRLARTEREFTADDLRRVMRPAPVSNWVGIAFTAAKRDGHIEPVSHATSTSRSRKNGSLRTWTRKKGTP